MSAKPVSPAAGKLYDEDFVLWTAETARLLRARRFEEVDIAHAAEEIEDMGKGDRREVESRLSVLLTHLLKWQVQPDIRSASWQATIAVQRAELHRVFKASPSLRATLALQIQEVYPEAIQQASLETGLLPDSFPAGCPFSLEQILDRNFLP